MIINIRGTGGSGKTWVARQLMTRFGATPVNRDGRIIGYKLHVVPTYDVGRYNVESGGCDRVEMQDQVCDLIQTFVLGPYETAGGGCDNLPKIARSQDDIEEEVKNQAAGYHVLFEGLLVSGIYGRYRDMARAAPDFRWVFLNTPLEQCLVNTSARRVAAGKPPEFKPDATVDKYRSVRSILAKARADGMKVWDVSSNEAVELIAGWIA